MRRGTPPRRGRPPMRAKQNLSRPAGSSLSGSGSGPKSAAGKVSLGGRDVEITFLKRMVLESGEGEYSESVVCQGLNAALEEGREALRKGKKIKEARIRLSADESSWEFTIKADLFSFQSMRMPRTMEIEEESDRDGMILERIALLEKAVGIMDELFAEFLKAKASPEWKTKNSARFEKWLSRK